MSLIYKLFKDGKMEARLNYLDFCQSIYLDSYNYLYP